MKNDEFICNIEGIARDLSTTATKCWHRLVDCMLVRYARVIKQQYVVGGCNRAAHSG